MRRSLAMTITLAFFATPAFSEDLHPLVQEGNTAYKSFCGHCHGLNMVNSGTTTYDLRKFPSDSAARFYDAVRNGKGDMPAWGDTLYPEEIDALWVYVATRGGTQPFPPEAEVPVEVMDANVATTETE